MIEQIAYPLMVETAAGNSTLFIFIAALLLLALIGYLITKEKSKRNMNE